LQHHHWINKTHRTIYSYDRNKTWIWILNIQYQAE